MGASRRRSLEDKDWIGLAKCAMSIFLRISLSIVTCQVNADRRIL